MEPTWHGRVSKGYDAKPCCHRARRDRPPDTHRFIRTRIDSALLRLESPWSARPNPLTVRTAPFHRQQVWVTGPLSQHAQAALRVSVTL
ncbi:hypothetical protein Srubr_39010 [Streptomyces rubradiris]|uniref:Uncharacterized protein n=1 Tax=Streptomyces rubradiris TaxID=285531 RepID=A0ABQ3RDX8_STRRR|nr:hypothetical protein GCM10018792_71690 [Streptomyces rubradiris]GHI54055.1 hypothetical protein Srubr_39010 [Streptomyces rubradiris]